MVEKKNPDYRGSVNNWMTCNPQGIVSRLVDLHEWERQKAEADAKLQATPEWKKVDELDQQIQVFKDAIRADIDQYGSFQDVEHGWYAVKQVRKTITFLADKVRQIIPQYADAVIDGVNKAKMEGLVKGGLITQEQVDQCGQTKEVFAYIIK